MKTYSRQYSGTEWERAGVATTHIIKPNDGSTPYMDFRFDTAPGLDRSRVASIELTLDDLLENATRLVGSRAELVKYLVDKMDRRLNHEITRADEAQKETAATEAALAKARKELDEAKMQKALRVGGGAL